MIDISVTPSTLEAFLTVGFVLVEAIVLYAGYGVIERAVSPALIALLADA